MFLCGVKQKGLLIVGLWMMEGQLISVLTGVIDLATTQSRGVAFLKVHIALKCLVFARIIDETPVHSGGLNQLQTTRLTNILRHINSHLLQAVTVTLPLEVTPFTGVIQQINVSSRKRPGLVRIKDYSLVAMEGDIQAAPIFCLDLNEVDMLLDH